MEDAKIHQLNPENKLNSKSTTPKSFWRITKFKNLSESNMSLMQERRQMFILLSRWLLVVATGIPLAMYQWMYSIWAVYLPACLLGLMAWDYISHLKHIREVKKELKVLAVKHDSFEQNYVLKRPDRFDIVSPYVLFTVFFGLIVAGYSLMSKYNEIHGDSTILNSIKTAKTTVKSGAIMIGSE
tara:strand:+ start:2598 stop:3149 length:552 start_codon:yes stop_codon:yes gene_type:complete